MNTSAPAWPVWVIGLLTLVVVLVLAAWWRKRGIHQKATDEAEVLAQHADADHEGARTRHGGGA